MLNEIYLLRHAQSADKQTGQSDMQRILKPSGEEQAQHVGKFLNKRKLIPDLVLTSPAQRAISTSTIICDILHYPLTDIQKMSDLYEANAAQYFDVLHDLNASIKRVALVAHNPGISRAAEMLTGNKIDLHPCELAIIQFEVDWHAITAGSGKLVGLFHPSIQRQE